MDVCGLAVIHRRGTGFAQDAMGDGLGIAQVQRGDDGATNPAYTAFCGLSRMDSVKAFRVLPGPWAEQVEKWHRHASGNP